MSLNLWEQKTFDYLRSHPDEERHWKGKVIAAARQSGDGAEISARLDRELWAYVQERANALPSWREGLAQAPRRTSMRNLAELLLRLWIEPRPRKRQAEPRDPARNLINDS